MIGGQAVQAARLVERFARTPGLEVCFVAVDPRLPGPLHLLQRVKYLRTIVTTVAYVGSLLWRVPRCDVVHAFSASYFSYLLAPLPAMMVGRLFGKRTVLNYRSGEADDHLTRWRRTAAPTMRRFADAIVAPSGYLVDVFARHGLAARSVFNFVDVASIPYRERSTPRPIFMCNRNFEPLYNVACVVRAFAVVQREVPTSRLLLAGDGSERPTLEALVRELGLQNVEFLGRIPPAQMGELYDRADVYLNAPNIDNMPGSIIEAFAAGLPVVTTDAGGIPYIVEGDRTGLIVARDDHEAMAHGALRLLHEPGLALRLASAARAECMERYVWESVRESWQSLYASLVGRVA
jgi:glycosyltransferase involved in cell wall biosynthesis